MFIQEHTDPYLAFEMGKKHPPQPLRKHFPVMTPRKRELLLLCLAMLL